jgi:hypothetical protein
MTKSRGFGIPALAESSSSIRPADGAPTLELAADRARRALERQIDRGACVCARVLASDPRDRRPADLHAAALVGAALRAVDVFDPDDDRTDVAVEAAQLEVDSPEHVPAERLGCLDPAKTNLDLHLFASSIGATAARHVPSSKSAGLVDHDENLNLICRYDRHDEPAHGVAQLPSPALFLGRRSRGWAHTGG